MQQSSHRKLFTLLCLPAIFIGLAAQMDASEPPSTLALQELVNSLKTQLGIDAVVSAAIVPTNTLLVSVQPGRRRRWHVSDDVRRAVSDFPGPGRTEGDCRPRARSRLDLHAPPISADRAVLPTRWRCVPCHAQASNESTVRCGSIRAPRATSPASSDHSRHIRRFAERPIYRSVDDAISPDGALGAPVLRAKRFSPSQGGMMAPL